MQGASMFSTLIHFAKTRSGSYMIFFINIVLSLLLYLYASVYANEKEKYNFKSIADQASILIQNHIKAYQQTLYASAALFDASNNISQKEWHDFYAMTKMNTFFKALKGIGFASFLRAEEKEAYNAKMRADGKADFAISTKEDRDFYAIVTYLAPDNEANRRVIGYDTASEAIRHEAILEAISSENISLSHKVILVQDQNNSEYGLMMYYPVYHVDMPQTTFEEKMIALKGFVYIAFSAKDIIEHALKESHQNIILALYDGENTTKENLLYSNEPASLDHNILLYKTNISINGKTWTLCFKSPQAFLQQVHSDVPLLTLALGIAFSFFILSITLSLVIINERAEKLTKKMSQDLSSSKELFKSVIQGLGDGVWDWDIKK